MYGLETSILFNYFNIDKHEHENAPIDFKILWGQNFTIFQGEKGLNLLQI